LSAKSAVDVYSNLAKQDIDKIKRFGISSQTADNIKNRIGAEPTQQAPAQRELSSQDQEALDWANSHLNDPRAAQIKQRLGR